MTRKLHGVRTGTVDTMTDGGRRAKWVPQSELTLISSADGFIHGSKDLDLYTEALLPRRIAANPNAAQAKAELFSKKKPTVKAAARLMVGFNVGSEPYWRAGEVYLLAYLNREEQLKNGQAMPAFSFYVGLGAFPGDKLVASERSAQLVFMNFGQPSKAFFSDMIDLSKEMAEDMNQESVLLELQENGQVIYLDYIEPKKRNWSPLDDTKKWLNENKIRIEPSVWRMK